MRIAFITLEYPPSIIGGAGVYARNITQELARLGHHIVVFTPQFYKSKREEYNNNNLEIYETKINHGLPFKALQFWSRLPNTIKNFEKEYGLFDIVHFNGISYDFLKKKLSKAPHIATIHHLAKDTIKYNNPSLIARIRDISGETGLFIPFIEKRCIKSVDKIVAVSDFTKKQIIKTYKVLSSKIETVYNGTSLYRCNFTKGELEETKRQFELPIKPIILFVGRIGTPRKNLDLLLKAFKEVLEKTDAILLVVGKGDQTEAKKLAESLGIIKNVIFAGFVDDTTLKKLYVLCDIYVCPSILEGFGLTILEAMACGKTVVASNTAAIPEVVGDAGILVEPKNPDALAEAIIDLLNNENKRKKLEKQALKRAHEKFTWSASADELLKVYENLRGEHK